MKKLSASGYQRAREFLRRTARPLEQALFAHEFEGAPVEPVLRALAQFRNPDGGFGRALEPDLRIPASSALGALTALDRLHELGRDSSDPEVRSAMAWLVERFDPELPGWRCVPAEVDAFPHAPHWSWALHEPAGPWNPLLTPGASLLSHLEHWDTLAPESIRKTLSEALVPFVTSITTEGNVDDIAYLARVGNETVRAKARALAVERVVRDPGAWTTYCAKPLKLAPAPSSPLSECLVSETAQNLDWEIEQQAADGSWTPNWDWRGTFPADWEIARREWQGELTLRTLRSLRAYGRLES